MHFLLELFHVYLLPHRSLLENSQFSISNFSPQILSLCYKPVSRKSIFVCSSVWLELLL